MVEKAIECKINICSGCGKEVINCDACGKYIEKDAEIVCLVVGFDKTKHFHNTIDCFPKV
jgi:hypothetical protein